MTAKKSARKKTKSKSKFRLIKPPSKAKRPPFWRASTLISTGCGVGYLPGPTGTWGSLFALIIFYPLMYQFLKIHLAAFLLLPLVVALVGVWAAKKYVAFTKEHDPRTIVIDEIAGQFIALTLFIILNYLLFPTICPPNSMAEPGFAELTLAISNITLAPFLAFRFFDIVKPWPISWIDRTMKGADGVMLDDIAAGIAAGLTAPLFILLFKLTSWC